MECKECIKQVTMACLCIYFDYEPVQRLKHVVLDLLCDVEAVRERLVGSVSYSLCFVHYNDQFVLCVVTRSTILGPPEGLPQARVVARCICGALTRGVSLQGCSKGTQTVFVRFWPLQI